MAKDGLNWAYHSTRREHIILKSVKVICVPFTSPVEKN